MATVFAIVLAINLILLSQSINFIISKQQVKPVALEDIRFKQEIEKTTRFICRNTDVNCSDNAVLYKNDLTPYMPYFDEMQNRAQMTFSKTETYEQDGKIYADNYFDLDEKEEREALFKKTDSANIECASGIKEQGCFSSSIYSKIEI